MEDNITLIDIFGKLTKKRTDCIEEDNSILERAQDYAFLAKRLQLTVDQVIILTALFHNFHRGLTLDELSDKMQWSAADTFKHYSDLEELVERKYIAVRERRSEATFCLSKQAVMAFQNNKPLENYAQRKEEYFPQMTVYQHLTEIARVLPKAERGGFRDCDFITAEHFSQKNYRHVAAAAKVLQLTDDEIVLLAKIVYNEEQNTYNDLFSEPEEESYYKAAIDNLCRLCWIFPNERDNYGLFPAVVEDLKNNRQYVCSLHCNDSEMLFEKLRLPFHLRFDKEMTYRDVKRFIFNTINENPHIDFCKKFEEINLSDDEKIVLIYACHRLVNQNDNSVESRRLADLFNKRKAGSALVREMEAEISPLLTDGWIEHAADNSMFGEIDKFTLTKKSKEKLLSDCKILVTKAIKDKRIKKSASFAEKQMFYNAKEGQQIAELTQLLLPEKFNDVQQRLEASGLRKGFACIFYGAAGTGKTETVYQLARQTGRDVFVVNIAEMKSMWHGESEKQVKELFETYETLVQNCAVTPILLFNEADGVFGKRRENLQGAADQSDNSVQNIILQELENLNGILIATTNLTQNLDKAFERRFLYKIKFEKPTLEAKKSIWQSMLKHISNSEAEQLAKNYDFTGGQIENVVRKNAVESILKGETASFEKICEFCEQEKLDTGRMRIGFCA